jgi:hypothetical protein
MALGCFFVLLIVGGAFWLVSSLLGGADEATIAESPPASVPTASALSGFPAAPEALGDRRAPFATTTAVDMLEAGQRAGLSVDAGAPVDDPQLCGRYAGCSSAARLGPIAAVVFESARAAQSWRDDTAEGAAAEPAGGRRYWSYIDYLEVEDPDVRAAWRDVQRDAIPAGS